MTLVPAVAAATSRSLSSGMVCKSAPLLWAPALKLRVDASPEVPVNPAEDDNVGMVDKLERGFVSKVDGKDLSRAVMELSSLLWLRMGLAQLTPGCKTPTWPWTKGEELLNLEDDR